MKTIIFIGGAMLGSVITTAVMCCLAIAQHDDTINGR